MKKIFGLLATLLFLNGCAESMALLGPASSSALSGGNIMQSTLTSVASYGVKKRTGKSPSEHLVAYVQKNNPQNEKEKCIKFLEKTNSEICAAVRKDILETKDKIFKKSKIENLALKSIQERRR